MRYNNVEIKTERTETGNWSTEVWVDGVKIEAVMDVKFEHIVGHHPTVSLEMIPENIDFM